MFDGIGSLSSLPYGFSLGKSIRVENIKKVKSQ